MKNILKTLFAASIVSLSLAAKAQSTEVPSTPTVPTDIAQKYYSALEFQAASPNIGLLTDKFKDAISAKVVFSKKFIKLKVQRNPAKCPSYKVCPAYLMPVPDLEPTVVRLEVVKFKSVDCYDIYYAKTSDDVKASTYEQMILEVFDSKRCQTFQPNLIAPESAGHLHYRITGVSSATQDIASANIHFGLIKVLPVMDATDEE